MQVWMLSWYYFLTGVLIRQKLGNIFDIILKKTCIFRFIYVDWSGGLLDSSKMQAFPSCGVIRGRKFNVPREKRIDETPQRSD